MASKLKNHIAGQPNALIMLYIRKVMLELGQNICVYSGDRVFDFRFREELFGLGLLKGPKLHLNKW